MVPQFSSAEPQEAVYAQCCRAFVVFHLRTLTMLDGQVVDPNERKEADSWFEQSKIYQPSDARLISFNRWLSEFALAGISCIAFGAWNASWSPYSAIARCCRPSPRP